MADYPQFIFQPTTGPDTGEGLAKGISQLGAGVAGALQKHEVDLQADASNEMIFSQALESGEINPQILGYKPGDTPSNAEMYAKFKGATRNQQNGWVTGLIGNYAGKLAEQQAEIRERIQHARYWGAMTSGGVGGTGGVGGVGPGVAVPVLDSEGNVRAYKTTLQRRGGPSEVILPNRTIEIPDKSGRKVLWHFDDNGAPYRVKPNGEMVPASIDDYAAIQAFQNRKAAAVETSGPQSPARGMKPAPAGRVKLRGPDPNNPGSKTTFTIIDTPENRQRAQAEGYEIIP